MTKWSGSHQRRHQRRNRLSKINQSARVFIHSAKNRPMVLLLPQSMCSASGRRKEEFTLAGFSLLRAKHRPVASRAGFYSDSIVRAAGLAVRGNDVYVVGAFTGAGLSDSGGIARWNETIDFTPPFTLGFSRTELLPGNIFKSRINSSERVTYLFEYSDDFQTWTPLMTNSETQFDFTNVMSLSTTSRVFRARGIP